MASQSSDEESWERRKHRKRLCLPTFKTLCEKTTPLIGLHFSLTALQPRLQIWLHINAKLFLFFWFFSAWLLLLLKLIYQLSLNLSMNAPPNLANHFCEIWTLNQSTTPTLFFARTRLLIDYLRKLQNNSKLIILMFKREKLNLNYSKKKRQFL